MITTIHEKEARRGEVREAQGLLFTFHTRAVRMNQVCLARVDTSAGGPPGPPALCHWISYEEELLRPQHRNRSFFQVEFVKLPAFHTKDRNRGRKSKLRR